MLTLFLSAWLDPQNPYKHFNDKKVGCYQRLWELEEGDEGNGAGRFEGARGLEAAAAVADAADEAERQRPEPQPLRMRPEAFWNDDEEALAGPQQEAPVPAPEPAGAADIPAHHINPLLALDEERIIQLVNNIPEGGARQLLGLVRPEDDVFGLLNMPDNNVWAEVRDIVHFGRVAPGQPRQQRLPRLGGQIARPAGNAYLARRANNGQEARREVPVFGQQNYIRRVMGEDWIGPAGQAVDLRDEENHEIDEVVGDGLAEPEVPVEEPPAFVVIPPRARAGRNRPGRERGRGR